LKTIEILGKTGSESWMPLTGSDPGHGDDTKERHEIFADLEFDDLLTAIRRAPMEPSGQ